MKIQIGNFHNLFFWVENTTKKQMIMFDTYSQAVDFYKKFWKLING